MTGLLVSVLMVLACLLPMMTPRREVLRRNVRGEPQTPASGMTDTALMMDLIGAMLAAGSPIEEALAVLANACPPEVARSLETVKGALDLGAEWDTAWAVAADGGAGHTVRELGSALRFTGTTGAPSAEIVHLHAAQFRRRKNREAEKRAAALGVRLVVPLGICFLPAFVCLGVLPVLLGLMPPLN